MIVIAQAGQAGKTSLLFDMHRLRKRVFHDRLKWPVFISPQGLESDQFDLPNTIYLLSVNKEKRVIGSWRMMPSTGPNMIRDIWPEFLVSLPMPSNIKVWEVSRFAVDDAGEKTLNTQVNYITAELFCALTELCLYMGIKQVFTLYDARIARILPRLNCKPYKISDTQKIDGISARTGCFLTNQEMLSQLRLASGICESLIDYADLPEEVELRRREIQAFVSHSKILEDA